MLLAFGLMWPRLDRDVTAARVAFWFLVYSGLAIVAAYLMASILGAGQSTIPLAGAAHGSALQETAIMVVGVFICFDRDYFICAHSLGPARRRFDLHQAAFELSGTSP